MVVLGLSFDFHDAAACLVRDGRIVAAAEEERFSRLKHDLRFPKNAIAYCLKEGGVEARDLACVAFYEKPARKLERMLQIAKAYIERADGAFTGNLARYLSGGFRVERLIGESIKFEGPILYSEHHLSHAASAFFLSPFDESSVLTIDGVGEWATTAQFAGVGTNLTPLREIHYPHSLGLLYSTLTAFLGFRVNEDEYKVMGLASYGTPRYRREMETLLQLFQDGSFALNLGMFAFPYSTEPMYSQELVELLGPPRLPGEPVATRHQDIAASLQSAINEALVALASSIGQLHQSDNLCMAGGVAYNCVANTEVASKSGFRKVWVQPAAGDNGAALGAALVCYYSLTDGSARCEPTQYDTCLGPAFDNIAILKALKWANVNYEEFTTDELCDRTAELIHRGLIVGWFQGRMEFGPRALGCRSILANPCDSEMKDILNRRVKFREEFRPFAPAVLEEFAGEIFDLVGQSPYMLFTPQVRPEWIHKIPAVTHVDGTARVQTVSKCSNPTFYRLIEAFGRLSGVPVVVNTSFNIAGEPIVCTPDDAIRCFLGTDIDALGIGDYLVTK